MLYANVLHAEARAYRFDNGRYFVTDPFWSEGKALEDELLKLGYFCAHTYHGGTYAVWQKGREFIFVILVGSIAWTVEVTGLPNYLQFISEYLGPALAHSDRLPDAEIKALREAKAKEAEAQAKLEVEAASNVTAMPGASADPAMPVNDVSCLAAIRVIDDGWRQCIDRNGVVRRVNGKAAPGPKKPLQLCAPDNPDGQKAAKA